jgi:hypothetical protein
MTEAAEATVVTGTFQVTLNLTDKRGLSMTGHVYLSDSPKDINARIDLYQDVLDRQAIRADLITKRALIVQHNENLSRYSEHYQSLVRKQRGARKLTPAEKLEVDNYDSGVAKASEMIQSLESAIAAGEARLKE